MVLTLRQDLSGLSFRNSEQFHKTGETLPRTNWKPPIFSAVRHFLTSCGKNICVGFHKNSNCFKCGLLLLFPCKYQAKSRKRYVSSVWFVLVGIESKLLCVSDTKSNWGDHVEVFTPRNMQCLVSHSIKRLWVIMSIVPRSCCSKISAEPRSVW